jgi:hypothetical protein
MKSITKITFISVLIGALPAILFGALAMYAAWQHNPQGEFHDYQTGAIQWADWLTVGLVWFAVVGLLSSVLCFISISIYHLIRKRTQKKDK